MSLSVLGAQSAEMSAGSARRVLRDGDVLAQGTKVVVREGGFVQLQLEDGSIVRLGPESELELNELTEMGPLKARRIDFGLKRGRVDSSVKPQSQDRAFRIRTPTAVAAVRGTEFGVTSSPTRGTAVDVVEGSVAVSRSGTRGEQLVERSQGLLIAQSGMTLVAQQLAEAPQLPKLPRLTSAADLLLSLAPLESGHYEVVVYSKDAIPQVIRHVVGRTGELTIPGLPVGSFNLAVRVISDSGLASLPAMAVVEVDALPESPILLTPDDGKEVSIARDIELGCTEVEGVAGYVFELSSEPSFTLNLEAVIRSTCRLILRPNGVGPMYWRVASRLVIEGGTRIQSKFSTARNIEVAPRPTPPDVEVSDVESVTVTWPRKAGYTYRLEVALDPSFAHADIYPDSGSSAVQLSASPCADRYLRIRAKDHHGVDSEFSVVHLIRKPPSICSAYALPLRDASGNLVRSGRESPPHMQ